MTTNEWMAGKLAFLIATKKEAFDEAHDEVLHTYATKGPYHEDTAKAVVARREAQVALETLRELEQELHLGLPTTIDSASPCTVTVVPLEQGGVAVTVGVPTYGSGLLPLTLDVERNADGDWVIAMPTSPDMEVINDIGYLGAPDVPRPAAHTPDTNAQTGIA